MTSNNKYLTNLFLNTFIFLITFLIFMIRVLLQLRPKKIEKALVSGNAGNVKNLPPGGRKFIFFYRFSGDIVFSSLVSFAFFYYCFFFVCLFVAFWNWKCIFWYTFDCPGCVFYCMYIPGNCWISKCSCCFKATNNASNMCTCTCVYSLCN